MNSGEVRNSNLELYRIIVMLLIIAHHYVVNSGLTSVGGPIALNPTSGSSMFLLLFGAWGKTGINCFVLITGYFMCKSQITLKKFLRLFLQVMFYRILIGAIFWSSSYEPLNIESIVKTLLPIRTVGTGFTSAYLLFFLFIPFLNVLVNNLNEKQHILLLCLLSFTYIFLGTVPFFSITMNYVSWFMVLYVIASYIRMYPKKIFDSSKVWGWISLIVIVIASASVVVCAYLSKLLDSFLWYYFVQDSNTVLAVLVGVSTFLFFRNLKMKHHPLINRISSTCFGVLLIHANSDTMRRWLWKDVLDNVGMYNSSLLFLHFALSVLGVFVICSVIDMARIKLVETPFFNRFDKVYDKLCLWFDQKKTYVFRKLNIKED